MKRKSHILKTPPRKNFFDKRRVFFGSECVEYMAFSTSREGYD